MGLKELDRTGMAFDFKVGMVQQVQQIQTDIQSQPLLCVTQIYVIQ